MEEVRDVNWDVTFNVTVNGKEVSFDELNDAEKEHILNSIREDYYSGTF